MNTFIHSYIHTFIHSYIHTFIHSYIHTFIHSYIHTFIHSFIHSYIHTFIHSYIDTARSKRSVAQQSTASDARVHMVHMSAPQPKKRSSHRERAAHRVARHRADTQTREHIHTFTHSYIHTFMSVSNTQCAHKHADTRVTTHTVAQRLLQTCLFCAPCCTVTPSSLVVSAVSSVNLRALW